MAKTAPPPSLSIRTFFTPTTFVCLLALTLCTPTSTTALPIGASPSSASAAGSSSSIPSPNRVRRDSGLRVDTTSTQSTDSPSIASAPPALSSSGAPFRTVSRPITIKVDLSGSSSPSSKSDPSYALMIQRTEQQEQFLRQQELQTQEELSKLQKEQDQLEKEEQDRDQLLDNEEESLLDQDPETVRRRQEESLGLWMTDSEYDALNQGPNSSNSNEPSRNSPFDLYADDFKEVQGVVERRNDEEHLSTSSSPSVQSRRSVTASALLSARKGRRLQQRQVATEEEMLKWPVVNAAQFEDRKDEEQDEYDDLV